MAVLTSPPPPPIHTPPPHSLCKPTLEANGVGSVVRPRLGEKVGHELGPQLLVRVGAAAIVRDPCKLSILRDYLGNG